MINNNSYYDPDLQQRISERLTNLFTPVSRVDRIIYSIIREMMDVYVVPYFTDVITRHTQEEFHIKVAEGFDLVDDMRVNHPHIFGAFMRVVKKFKRRLVFNEVILVDMIIDIVSSPPYNWIITSDERIKLFDMVSKLKMEIYS